MDPTIATNIIDTAGHEAGWVAMLFAALVICGFTLLGWFVRQLWLDLREVRNYQITTLADMQAASIDMQSRSLDVLGEVRGELCKFRKTLDSAPCGTAIGDVLQQFLKNQNTNPTDES